MTIVAKVPSLVVLNKGTSEEVIVNNLRCSVSGFVAHIGVYIILEDSDNPGVTLAGPYLLPDVKVNMNKTGQEMKSAFFKQCKNRATDFYNQEIDRINFQQKIDSGTSPAELEEHLNS